MGESVADDLRPAPTSLTTSAHEIGVQRGEKSHETQNGGINDPPFPESVCCMYPEFGQQPYNTTFTLNGTPFSPWSLSPLNKHRDVCSEVTKMYRWYRLGYRSILNGNWEMK